MITKIGLLSVALLWPVIVSRCQAFYDLTSRQSWRSRSQGSKTVELSWIYFHQNSLMSNERNLARPVKVPMASLVTKANNSRSLNSCFSIRYLTNVDLERTTMDNFGRVLAVLKVSLHLSHPVSPRSYEKAKSVTWTIKLFAYRLLHLSHDFFGWFVLFSLSLDSKSWLPSARAPSLAGKLSLVSAKRGVEEARIQQTIHRLNPAYCFHRTRVSRKKRSRMSLSNWIWSFSSRISSLDISHDKIS